MCFKLFELYVYHQYTNTNTNTIYSPLLKAYLKKGVLAIWPVFVLVIPEFVTSVNSWVMLKPRGAHFW